MKETQATRHMMQNWKRQRPELLWFHKIADSRFGAITNDRAIDVVACYKGRMLGLEFKLVKEGISISINRIRSNQIITLNDIVKAGGLGYIIIIRYYSGTKKHAYLISPKCIFDEIKNAQSLGKKSIRLEVFNKYRFEYVRNGSKINWDMSLIERKVDNANRII